MRNSAFFLSLILLTIHFQACNPSRRVQEGDYLLLKNNIDLSHMLNDSTEAMPKKEFKLAVNKEDIDALVRQKPNRKIFGLSRMYLGFYNMIDPEKKEVGIEKKKLKTEEKNKKRREKGKKEKEYKKTWREWFSEDIGELPILFDSSYSEKSITQIENYLYNKGFFSPSVYFDLEVDSLKRRIVANYHVRPNVPHRINKLEIFIQDTNIQDLIDANFARTQDSVIYKGDRFDLNDLQSYQKIITRRIRDEGYYLFNTSMVYFKADTNLNDHKVDLSLYINDERLGQKNKNENSSFYKKYYVDNIYINTSYPSINYPDGSLIPYDTLHFDDKEIMYQYRFRYNPKLFERSLLIQKDSLYSVEATEITFKKLFELGSFDLVNISYNIGNVSDSLQQTIPLDAFINLKPTKNQSVSFETTATNNGGNLGISGSVAYSHKNIFRGAEQLRVSLTGGIEAQQTIEANDNNDLFNTVEIAPELEIIFPHFVAPFSYQRFKRILNPKTSIAIAYNYQNRPDYTRTTTTPYFGYKWNSSKVFFHQLNIFQLAFTKIDRSAAFEEYLRNLNNAVLEASYTDNVVPSIKYIGTFNNQANSFQNQVFYTRFFLQEAGIGSHLLSQAFNAPQDENGSYLFSGIPFAHFIKTEVDFRSYLNFDQQNTLAYRVDIGSAWTLQNLSVLPFTDAFFVGGSNSNRAWRPRTLGPGSSFDSTGVEAFDKIGEIKIDLSLEYRFNLVSFFDLAVFTDASNVWYMKKEGLGFDNPSVFDPSRFLGEIGIGAGLGVRLNFNFFLIRFDFGLQIKDPSLPKGERWIFTKDKPLYDQRVIDVEAVNGVNLGPYKPQTIFNLAIGYPF